MAPFARGRRGRGGPTTRGRGRGSNRGGIKQTFYSTRVEDAEAQASDSQSVSEAEVSEDVGASSNGSDAESEDEAAVVKPYSALMQALTKSAVQDRKPARKKRKLSPKHANGNINGSAKPQEEVFGETRNGSATDEAEDSEEEGSVALEQLDDDEADVVDDVANPFEAHLSNVSDNEIAQSIKELNASSWTTRKSNKDGWKRVFTGPSSRAISYDSLIPIRSTSDMKLKQRLKPRAEKPIPQLVDEYEQVATPMFGYKDVYFCERTPNNASGLRSLTTTHALNHVLKTRDRVIKNTERLAKAENDDLECRDQGFTRPKILFVLPTRQSCAKTVESLVALYEPEQQENKGRFQKEYSRLDEDEALERPEDFKELFGGNDDDEFRVGMKFTRKTVKFYSKFFNSDIIFASPLGLRRAIGDEGSKKQDYDFLSSIEIVVVDHADALLMQNWEHIEYVFKYLNLLPRESHDSDYSRIRSWYLDNQARYMRQTVVLAAYNTPEINKLYSRDMNNVEGKVKISKEAYPGAILQLGVQVRNTFQRFASTSLASEPDARFKLFSDTIIPTLDRSSRGRSGRGLGVLVYIDSYLDFVRVRNFMANSTAAQNISFGSISEYTAPPEISRARSHFITGRHSVLIYTGRAHHFKRYWIRGCKRVIFYSLPENPLFYQEIAGGFLAKSISEGVLDPNDANCKSLFSKRDFLKLERIVGTSRMGPMMNERGGDMFEFV